jgi:hypothetical protein
MLQRRVAENNALVRVGARKCFSFVFVFKDVQNL